MLTKRIEAEETETMFESKMFTFLMSDGSIRYLQGQDEKDAWGAHYMTPINEASIYAVIDRITNEYYFDTEDKVWRQSFSMTFHYTELETANVYFKEVGTRVNKMTFISQHTDVTLEFFVQVKRVDVKNTAALFYNVLSDESQRKKEIITDSFDDALVYFNALFKEAFHA